MRTTKYAFLMALLLVPFCAQLSAQNLQANVAGSTAFWLEAGVAAYTLGGTTTTCAWTTPTSVDGSSYVYDQRVPLDTTGKYYPWSIDYGALWVTWTPGSTGTCANPSSDSNVWAYISLDSVLGIRCFFSQPQCVLNTTHNPGDAGANALPGIADTPLPASILNAFDGNTITIAASDILPADAKFATFSTLSTCGALGKGTQFIGLGYGPGPFAPQPVYSYFSQLYLNINDFNIYGYDPVGSNPGNPNGPSPLPIPSYNITPVGAVPVVVAVNTSNTAGFGAPSPAPGVLPAPVSNINRAELGLMFTALLGRTADVVKQPFAGVGATYFGVSALIPSPLSGAYNVFEHSITSSKELYRSQDINNCDPYAVYDAVTNNPLINTRKIGNTTSARYRIIGTQEMLSFLQSMTDSIGYELWSAENFAAVSNVKYVTVDGIDPLQDSYTDGAIPQGASLANVTMSHVKDGSYPIWNEERLISYPSSTSAAQLLASYTQAQVSFGAGATHPDFVPDSQLNVFHMHFAPVGVNFNAITDPNSPTGFDNNVAFDGPKVCGFGSPQEDGGDAGGLVLTLQAGADYCILKGNYGTSAGTGPTNTASFGARQ